MPRLASSIPGGMAERIAEAHAKLGATALLPGHRV